MNSLDVSSRLLNQPLLVDETFAFHIQGSHESGIKLEGDKPAFVEEQAGTNFFVTLKGKNQYRPYPLTDEGLAIISVYGTLYHKETWAGYYYTGYESINRRHAIAEEDPEVKAIVLDINSNGGEVAGCFECVDDLVKKKTKPLYAMVDNKAHSAGYAVATAADKIYMTRTGSVGSIGVVTAHMDYSKRMKDLGVKPTLLFAGKQKVDGNPYEALPREVKDRIDARLNVIYEVFVSTVSKNRGMDADTVRATEAGVFSADNALDVGLADAITSPAEMYEALKIELIGSQQEEYVMSSDTQGPDASSQGPSPEDMASAKQQGHTEGLTAGAKAERQRIQDILACDEAQTRPAAAQQIAMTTDMPLEQATTFLKGLPEEKSQSEEPDSASSQGNAFSEAMSQDNPDLGSESENAEGSDADAGAMAFAGIARANGRTQ